jgi:acetyl esterase/lipase
MNMKLPSEILSRNKLLKQLRREQFEKDTREIKKRAKFLYVRGGHAKNEFLGFMTVLNMERALDVDIERRVRYADDDKSLYLNIYQPKNRDMRVKLPVFVYIHGGGWIGGLPENREAYTTRIAEAGYFVISLFYGHSPEYAHPKPLENIYKAFSWLKRNAQKYNVDADAVFLGGESAGAHMCAMAGATASNAEYASFFKLPEDAMTQRIRGLVLNCGVYDLDKAYEIDFKNIGLYIDSFAGAEYKSLPENVRRQMSPVNYLNGNYPPVFAISAENDALNTLTYDFVFKLDGLGVNVRHFEATGLFAVHAFAIAPVLDISKQALKTAGRFMQDILEKDKVGYPVPQAEAFDFSNRER